MDGKGCSCSYPELRACVPPSFSHTKGNRKVLLQLLKRREKKMAFLMEGEHLFIT